MIPSGRPILQLAFVCLLLWSSANRAELAATASITESRPLDLRIISVKTRFAPYADFCRRHPNQCRLDGAAVVDLSPSVLFLLEQINGLVNREITFESDSQQYQREEYWALPLSGRGDCEDIALEKRRRLAEAGLPMSALRLAIVFHRESHFSHALLTVETSRGTYLLDSLNDQIQPWHLSPYNFEARENLNGEWEKYDQADWSYRPSSKEQKNIEGRDSSCANTP